VVGPATDGSGDRGGGWVVEGVVRFAANRDGQRACVRSAFAPSSQIGEDDVVDGNAGRADGMVS